MKMEIPERFARWLNSSAGSAWLDEQEAAARERALMRIENARRKLRDLEQETRTRTIGHGVRQIGTNIAGEPVYKHYSEVASINRKLDAIRDARRDVEALRVDEVEDVQLTLESILAGVDSVVIVTEELV